MNKKSKIFIIIFFLIILIPVIIVGSINYIKEKKLKDKIENSKSTKILSLNNINSSISLQELFNIEKSEEYAITKNKLKYTNDDNKEDFTIKYTNTSFFGAQCIKEYNFVDEKLNMITIEIDTSHWIPKDILEEINNLNGEPDVISLKKDNLGSDIYHWYGKNGKIIYTDDNINNTIELVFEVK